MKWRKQRRKQPFGIVGDCQTNKGRCKFTLTKTKKLNVQDKRTGENDVVSSNEVRRQCPMLFCLPLLQSSSYIGVKDIYMLNHV